MQLIIILGMIVFFKHHDREKKKLILNKHIAWHKNRTKNVTQNQIKHNMSNKQR